MFGLGRCLQKIPSAVPVEEDHAIADIPAGKAKDIMAKATPLKRKSFEDAAKALLAKMEDKKRIKAKRVCIIFAQCICAHIRTTHMRSSVHSASCALTLAQRICAHPTKHRTLNKPRSCVGGWVGEWVGG